MTQDQALEIMKLGKSVFLTGAAGAGKTYVLNQYIEYLREKRVNVWVTASTGIAATHLSGQTIHSWAGLGAKDYFTDDDIQKAAMNKKRAKRLFEADVLVIDEVSMLQAYQFEALGKILQVAKGSMEPFGGMQIILSGDFFQLPPIGRGERAPFVFESPFWNELKPVILYLSEQHRQSDDDGLTQILNHIRSGEVPESSHESLQECQHNMVDAPVHLYTHNRNVDTLNGNMLAAVEEDEEVFTAQTRGKRELIDMLLRSTPTPEELILKIGARVMCTQNNPEEDFYNGSLGTLVDFTELGAPIVELDTGKEIEIPKMEWKVNDEEGNAAAAFVQYPLRLAWAITVHKSQGMTLDSVEVDLSQAFEPGMGYVALSRVRSLSGLKLLGINDVALLVSPLVLQFDRQLAKRSDTAIARLEELGEDIIIGRQADFISSVSGKAVKVVQTSTTDESKGLLESGLSIIEVATRRGLTPKTVTGHVEKILESDPLADLDHVLPDATICDPIIEAFEKLGNDFEKMSPVYNALDSKFTYGDIAVVRAFLRAGREI